MVGTTVVKYLYRYTDKVSIKIKQEEILSGQEIITVHEWEVLLISFTSQLVTTSVNVPSLPVCN